MKSVFAMIVAISVAHGALASLTTDGIDPVKITISSKDSGEELYIDVAPDTDGNLSLSVFSQNGEIVVTEDLVPGTNRVKVRHLRPGQYVAVVRQNDEFRKKQEFEVN